MAQFFFAWTDAADTTFSASDHARVDEDVFAFELIHEEGEFAQLRLDVRNPRVGLLSEGRDLWLWFSWSDDTAGAVQPLLFGRLVGVPENLQDDIVRFVFTARPDDFDARKAAAAAALKVAPFYDPIWVHPDERDNPDTVLEGRPALWHIDPVTHAVTASDIITGEDGLYNFGSGFFFDNLQISYGQPPITRINCVAEVNWDQAAAGDLDLRQTLIEAFAAAGTTDGGFISSYTGEGLERDWPKQGDRIGSGWEVGTSSVTRVDDIAVIGQMFTIQAGDELVGFPLWVFDPTFHVRYAIERQRKETLTFSIASDVQPLLSAPAEDSTIDLKLATSEIDKPIDPGDALPIGDPRRKSYFLTDRGKRSVEHLIVRCRAQLLYRARAVHVSFDADFAEVAQLSCRHSATIAEPRLPGAQATGKVIGYRLALEGDAGSPTASVKIACTIGRGQSLAPDLGSNDYVDGYVELGWQSTSGGATEVAAGDIAYASYDNTVIDDDGVDLLGMNVAHAVLSCVVVGGEAEQEQVLTEGQPPEDDPGGEEPPPGGGSIPLPPGMIPGGTGKRFSDVSAACNALNTAYTQVALTLRPLKGGPFVTAFDVGVTDLMIPKTIDLEAA